jgi:hypothetical protein
MGFVYALGVVLLLVFWCITCVGVLVVLEKLAEKIGWSDHIVIPAVIVLLVFLAMGGIFQAHLNKCGKIKCIDEEVVDDKTK